MRRSLQSVMRKYAKKSTEVPPEALRMIFPLMIDDELPNYEKPPDDPEPFTEQGPGLCLP